MKRPFQSSSGKRMNKRGFRARTKNSDSRLIMTRRKSALRNRYPGVKEDWIQELAYSHNWSEDDLSYMKSVYNLVLNSFKNPQYSYRTCEGIAKELGIPVSEVELLSEESPDILKSRKVNQYGQKLFITREQLPKRSLGNKMLAALSGSPY